jgi:hypothetical protein
LDVVQIMPNRNLSETAASIATNLLVAMEAHHREEDVCLILSDKLSLEQKAMLRQIAAVKSIFTVFPDEDKTALTKEIVFFLSAFGHVHCPHRP